MGRSYSLFTSLILAGGIGWIAAMAFQGFGTAKEPRFPQLTMEQLQRPAAPPRREDHEGF
jgi:4-carboxymuconolactone decarboxylase